MSGDQERRTRGPSEDTDEVPIDSQARAIMMRAASLRKEAMARPEAEREALLREADDLERHAILMSRGGRSGEGG